MTDLPIVPALYASMALCVASFGAHAAKKARVGRPLFFVAFLFAAAALVMRLIVKRAVPLQSMFEVFLCLSALVWPMSLFWRRALAVPLEAADPLLMAGMLAPASFAFGHEVHLLPPALKSALFIPHVASYLAGYVVMFRAAIVAVLPLTSRGPLDRRMEQERAAWRLVRLGFPLITLGMILGAWWAKLAWTDYWSWDPKELCSLATWAAYLFYLHFRSTTGGRHPRVNSALVLLGCIFVLFTLILVQYVTQGMHGYAQ